MLPIIFEWSFVSNFGRFCEWMSENILLTGLLEGLAVLRYLDAFPVSCAQPGKNSAKNIYIKIRLQS